MSNNEEIPRYRYVGKDKVVSEKEGVLAPNETGLRDDLQKGKLRLIDRWAATRMLGISLSTMERRQREDVHFPVPLLIGTRNVRWLEHEVEGYILSLPRADRFG
jgi:predicted DNA-binding transcriptional regulator AlpA